MTETHTTALVVLDGPLGTGTVVHEWYADGVTPESLLLGASMSKSALAHLVGSAIAEGALRLDDTVARHVPELAGSGYAGCTVEQLLTMTTGTDWVEDHRDPTGPATRLISCFAGAGGSSRRLLAEIRAMDPPGTRWEYNTADSQVLDWVRERATGTTFAEAMTTCGAFSAASATPSWGSTPKGWRWPAAAWPPARRTGCAWQRCSSPARRTTSACSTPSGYAAPPRRCSPG